MIYGCQRCGWVGDSREIALNEPLNCHRCGGALEQQDPSLSFQVSAEQLQRLPYPVALTAHRLAEAVQAKRDVLRCVFLLKDCFEASIRYAGAVLLAAYLRDGEANPPRRQRLLDKMIHPSLGTWVETVVKDLAYDLMDGPDPGKAIAHLFGQRSGEYKRGKPGATSALRSCREFTDFRNNIIGHGAVQSDGEYARHLHALLPGLQTVLHELMLLAPRWQLCLVTVPDRCQVWMGTSNLTERRGSFSGSSIDHFVLCGSDPQDKPVDLFPFLCYLPRPKSGHGLYYHDGLKYERLPRQARLLEFDSGFREERAEPWPGWEDHFGKVEVIDACQRWKRLQEDYDWPSLPLPPHDHMVGRRFAVAKVRQFLQERESGLFLISGEPGKGKTTLWSHLIETEYQHNNPPPIQFSYRRTEGRTDPYECMSSLYWRLVEVHSLDSSPRREQLHDLGKMVGHLSQLLRKVKCSLSRPQLIFIDALDEADPSAPGRNAYQCIPEHLPAGIYVIATTRPTRGERILRARQNADCLDLEDPDLRHHNMSDAKEYVEERLKDTGVPEDVQKEIVRVGDGNFLILKRLCDNVQSGMRPEEVKALLRRLDAGAGTDKLAFIYMQDWQRLKERLFGGEYRMACDIVGILAHARCPLTASVLCRVLRCEPDDVDHGLQFVAEFLKDRPAPDPTSERDYRIYHEAFKDFLQNYLEPERQRWRELLAEYCLAWRDHPEGFSRNYALRFAAAHLIEAGWWERLEALLKDWEFLEAKAEMVLEAEAEGEMVYDLARAFDRAREAWPGGAFPPLLRLLRQAIYNDLSFLRRHPKALFQCLWNRGWWYDCAEAARHYESPAEGTPLPWHQPGEKLSALLERWRAAKEKKGGFTWLRSLRPPQFPLGQSPNTPLHCDCRRVSALSVSPDGKAVISCGDIDYDDCNILKIWDVEAGKEIETSSGDYVVGITFDSTGRPVVAVAIGGETEGERKIILLRGRYFEETLSFADEEAEKENPLPDQYLKVSELVFSPDGYIFRIFKSNLGGYFVGIWDAETRKCLRSFRFSNGSIHGLTFARQGRRFAFGSEDGSVHICEIQPSRDDGPPLVSKRRRLTGHEGTVRAVAFSPCGRWIASGGDDGIIRVRSVEADEELVPPLKGHEGTVNCLAFSEDGRILASGGADRMIRLWQLADARELPPLYGHEGPVNCLVFMPGGRSLASSADDGTVRLWELSWGQEKVARLSSLVQPEGTFPITFSPDGQLIATGSQEAPCIWEMASGRLRFRLEPQSGEIGKLAFSPDGRYLAALFTTGGPLWLQPLLGDDIKMERTVHVWDIQTGHHLESMQLDERTEGFVWKKLADLGLSDIDLPSTPEMTGIWIVTSENREMVVRSRAGEEIAWFPVDFQGPQVRGKVILPGIAREETAWFPAEFRPNPTAHPNGQLWAGESNGHFYLLTLEGAAVAQGESAP